MPQVIAVLVVFGMVVLAASIVLYFMFWPFIMAQDYFLYEHGIDQYSTPGIVVGVIAQLIYIGAAVTGLWIAGTWKPPTDRTGKALGTITFLGVCAVMFCFFLPSDMDPQQRLDKFNEKCVEEVEAEHPSSAGQPRRVDLIDQCVDRKVDDM